MSRVVTRLVPRRRCRWGQPVARTRLGRRSSATASVLRSAWALTDRGPAPAGGQGEGRDAAYSARTGQELRQLTADLPGTPGAGPVPMPTAGMFAGLDRCLLCVLLIACPPLGIALWLLSRRRPSPDRDGRPTLASGPAMAGETPPGPPRPRRC